MKLTFPLPAVVVITESTKSYNTLKSEVKEQIPDLHFYRVSLKVAKEYNLPYSEDNLTKSGLDWWVPKESIEKLDRRFRKKLRKLTR